MLLAGLQIALLALGAAGTSMTPGDYHRGTTLVCSDCHVMHGQQSHGYNSNGSGWWTAVGSAGPYEYLLRNEFNDLCLTCHDNSSIAPDVLDANTGKYVGEVRLAGFLNRENVVGQPASGHTIDSLSVAPGSNPEWKAENANGAGNGLRCINCHHHHGRASGSSEPLGAYRNLHTDAGNWNSGEAVVTYAIGTNDLTKDLYERQERGYDWADMDMNEPDTTASKSGKWCGGCHTNFHGTPGDPNIGGVPSGSSFIEMHRHPVSGVNIGALGGGHSSLSTYAGRTNKVKVMSASGVWDGTVGDVTPTCMSCHKAHGNANAFGLIYMSGTGTITENGDTNGLQAKDLCI